MQITRDVCGVILLSSHLRVSGGQENGGDFGTAFVVGIS
jgi:hypothetical protein